MQRLLRLQIQVQWILVAVDLVVVEQEIRFNRILTFIYSNNKQGCRKFVIKLIRYV